MTNLIQKQIFMFGFAVLLQNAFAEMGPLNLDVLSAGKCDGTNNDVLTFEIVSLSETEKGITASLKTKFPLDQSVSYTIRVDEIADGQVKEGVFRHGGPYFCQNMEKFMGDIWDKLTAAMGMAEGCPKPEGNYETVDFPINYDDIKLDSFLYGRFKANLELKRMGQVVDCIFFEFTNSPEGESVK